MEVKKPNIVREKSYNFAVRIVKAYKYLTETKKEFVLSKQLLRSGTSIGANIREADNAESKADFIHKLGIAQKETDETCYWIELLIDTAYLSENEGATLLNDSTELLKLIRSIIIKTKSNLNSK